MHRKAPNIVAGRHTYLKNPAALAVGILSLLVKHIYLCICLAIWFLPILRLFRNIVEFGVKKKFTGHRTAVQFS